MLTEQAPPKALPPGWEAMRHAGKEQLDQALAAIADPHGPAGIHLHARDLPALWGMFRERFKFVHAAGGVVTDERGRLLAIHRLGKWDLPKGKVDPGEAVDAAALREVREECGVLHLRIGRPLAETWHTYTHKGRDHLKRTDWFRMRGSSTDELVPQLDEDISAVEWLDREGVQHMREATYPSLRPVIDAWLAEEREGEVGT